MVEIGFFFFSIKVIPAFFFIQNSTLFQFFILVFILTEDDLYSKDQWICFRLKDCSGFLLVGLRDTHISRQCCGI